MVRNVPTAGSARGKPQILDTFAKVYGREIQKQILTGYELDFSKHASYFGKPNLRFCLIHAYFHEKAINIGTSIW